MNDTVTLFSSVLAYCLLRLFIHISCFQCTSDACFDCLPPYASMLAINERNTYSRFLNALRAGDQYILSQETIKSDQLIQWVRVGKLVSILVPFVHAIMFLNLCSKAYNVALTRCHEIWEPSRQKLIAPMVDLVRINNAVLAAFLRSLEKLTC